MPKVEKDSSALKRIFALEQPVADGTAALGERLRLALEFAKARGAKTAHEFCKIIRRYASPEVMEKAGLPEGAPIARTVTLNEMDVRFHRVEQDRRLSSFLRNEAAEIGYALSFILPMQPGQPENEILQKKLLGRVCRFCWRTEAVKSGDKPFGFCHEHDVHAWSYKNDDHLKRLRANVARQTRLLEYFLEDKISNAGKPGLPKVVTVAQGKEIIFGILRNQIYPRLDPAPPIPEGMGCTTWIDYVKANYPETDCYIRRLKDYSTALSNPLETVQALEGRKLTDKEVSDIECPTDAVPILRRCEAWLLLAETSRHPRKPVF